MVGCFSFKKKKNSNLPAEANEDQELSILLSATCKFSAPTPSTSVHCNYHLKQMHTCCGSEKAQRNTSTSSSHFKSKASHINTKNCYKSFLKNSNSLTCHQLCSQHISQPWRQTQELQLSPVKHFLPS